MKRLLMGVGMCLLAGCSSNDVAPEGTTLKAACQAFEQYQTGRGFQERKEFLNIAGEAFREAAFLADSARYEVLAEYTDAYLDRLGNLYRESSDAIEKFCQDLKQ